MRVLTSTSDLFAIASQGEQTNRYKWPTKAAKVLRLRWGRKFISSLYLSRRWDFWEISKKEKQN